MTAEPEAVMNPMVYIDTDDPQQLAAFKQLNSAASLMYREILDSCPESAERTLAVRKLQEARMWANAAVVFNGRRYPV